MCLEKGSEYFGSAVCVKRDKYAYSASQTDDLKYSEPFLRHTLYLKSISVVAYMYIQKQKNFDIFFGWGAEYQIILKYQVKETCLMEGELFL